MKKLNIGPLILHQLYRHGIDQPLLAQTLGLTTGELYDLLEQEDVSILHLLRISEAMGVDLLPKISAAVGLPDMIAKGPQLCTHGFTTRMNGHGP